MFHKLRIQLTVLCVVVTALVLTILTLLCLYISETGARSQEEASLQSNLNTLYQNLQQQSSISHTWIRQTEYNYQISLRIWDNGTPLLFQTFSEDEDTKELLDLAAQSAASDHNIYLETAAAPKSYIYHKEFTITGKNGEQTDASAALIPRYDKTLSVLAIHPLTQLQSRIRTFRRIFLLADLAALTVLTIFFWFFVDRMLKPLQENHIKQTRFVASASHELRSPLTVILSNVDAVKNGSMEPDRQFLDTLADEGKRMAHLISDMLQLASADNHSWSMQLSETELDTLVLQVWEAFEPLARARRLQWEISLPEETIPHCLCDEERIRQLFSILIDNAFCYTQEGGRVRLSLEYSSCFRMTVSDNGPGIPDDQKAAVFERFYCVDSSHKNKAHFGLGLCIAQEIVKLHKGQLLLSDTPGGGATFTVILPLSSVRSANPQGS